MRVGDKATIRRQFTQEAVRAYVKLGGAAPTPGAVPEPMLAALFSYLLGVKLPGPGTNYLKQSLEFHGAADVDDELTTTVEVTRMRPEKFLVDFETTCRNSRGDVVCSGRALVLVKDVERAFDS